MEKPLQVGMPDEASPDPFPRLGGRGRGRERGRPLPNKDIPSPVLVVTMETPAPSPEQSLHKATGRWGKGLFGAAVPGEKGRGSAGCPPASSETCFLSPSAGRGLARSHRLDCFSPKSCLPAPLVAPAPRRPPFPRSLICSSRQARGPENAGAPPRLGSPKPSQVKYIPLFFFSFLCLFPFFSFSSCHFWLSLEFYKELNWVPENQRRHTGKPPQQC